MPLLTTAQHKDLTSVIKHIFGISLLSALALVNASAQTTTTTSTTDGKTPAGLSPGAPAGSYALSGFDTINPFSQSLNFRLPLIQVGGRGSAGYTMTLPIEKKWRVEHSVTDFNTNCPQGGCEIYAPVHTYTTNDVVWDKLEPGYGPGVMQGRRAGSGDTVTCGGAQGYKIWARTLTRLTFTTADGTEYELRDQQTGGQPLPGQCTGNASRGTVFVTSDGTFATFISDTPILDYSVVNEYPPFTLSGYLLMRDGTRYRIDGGYVSSIRDSNGNSVQYEHSVLLPGGLYGARSTDSLGRVVTVTYATPTRRYDEITYSGFGGAARTVRVWYDYLYNNRLRPANNEHGAEQPSTYQSLFPTVYALSTNPSNTQNYNPEVVSAVELPDGRTYGFYYNSYGELARVVLPTGGAFEYDYQPGEGVVQVSADQYEIVRRVIERRTYGTDGSLEGRITFGPCFGSTYPVGSGSNSCIQVDQRDPRNGNAIVESSRHSYYGNSGPKSAWFDPLYYAEWNEGKEFMTEALAADGTTVLRRTEQSWRQRATPSWWSGSLYNLYGPEPSNDPRLVETTTTLLDVVPHVVSRQSALNPANPNIVGFDQFNNQTDVWEYGYGYGSPGPLQRHTHTDYLTTNPQNGLNYPSSAHILSLPSVRNVYEVNPSNGAETLLAQSETRYDEAAYPVLVYGAITGWSDPGTAARGQATTTRRWLNTTGGYIETHAQYDQAGHARYSRDGRGLLWETSYADNYSDGVARNTYAHPTQSISPVPDIGWNTCSTTPLQTTTAYDYSTGLVTATTDANNQPTTIAYNDTLDRPTQVNSPDGGYTTYGYGRNGWGDYVHTQTLLSSATGLLTDNYSYTDGLGRPSRSFQYENSDASNPWLTNDTQYDALGRVWRVANTYRSAGSATAINPSGNWTTTQYDSLGRVTSVTSPDGAAVTTSYSGNQVTVTDPAGKKRSSYSDALGRLAVVVEDPNSLAYITEYTYDALDNLRVVKQGDQRRYFMYDSLSRLIRAKNPEQNANPSLALQDSYAGSGDGAANSQWSMAYAYDANGNLLSRTDARGVTANYTYDNINRNIRVAYPDPSASFTDHYYDSAVNGRGRMWLSASYVNSTLPETLNVVDNYDAAGRALNQRLHFWVNGAWSAAYNVQRGYDQAGHVTGQTYPSGRTVSYSYDRVGRASSFSGNLGDGISRSYATALAFDDSGRMTREQFGTDTPLYNKRHYNVRGQLYDMRLSSVNDDSNWNRGAVVNYYSSNFSFGGSLPTNNGNLLGQQYWIPGDDAISTYSYFQQNYDYDSLNRLSWVSLYSGGVNTGFQQNSYDRYGNRTISGASWGAGINAQQFAVDQTTNRLGVPAGQAGVMQYDANGNLTNDTYTGFGSRTYDAENRMVAAADSGGNQSAYTYDGDGRRVKRQTGGQTTWQVYGIDGELVAEYAANAAPSAPRKEYGYRNGELLITADAPSPAGVNLALGKPATQSSDPFAAPASRALDGNTNGLWANNSVTHTDYNYEAWWQVDLGSVQSIGSIQLWNRTDCCAERLSNFYLLVSDVPFTSTDLTTSINQAGVSSYYTLSTVAGSLTQAVNRSGRYVRVQLGGTNYLSLAEVEVFSSGSFGGAIEWLVSDQLGTPRMEADKSGSLSGIGRHDYLPFGEEMFAGSGGRTISQGYVADGVRQKFTGKERDNETSLDYFGARYYSSSMGRFTSADPIFFQKGMLTDPQRYNLYAYVRNNPLKFIDPKGEAIELTGGDKERQRKLELLRKVVGKDAGSYLYENKGKDGKYYVGIYTNGPDGKGKSFEQLNKVTGDVSKIINDKFVAEIQFVPNGTKVEFAGRGAVIGNIQDGGTPGATGVDEYGHAKIFMLDPSLDPGKLPGSLMSNGQPTQMTDSDVLGHELGHVLFEWGHVTGPSNFVGVDLENQTRKLRDPSAPTRTGHQQSNDAVGPQPFSIKIRPGITLTP